MSASVLFLDIDGVLNCYETWDRPRIGMYRIDPERVDLLNDIVATTGCLIVVSSTWRRDRDCRQILRDYGFTGTFPPEWRTPVLSTRGREIERWLSRNPVTSYAIVDDDDDDMLPEQMPHFVQTSFEHGLTRLHADRLIALLSRAASPSLTSKEG